MGMLSSHVLKVPKYYTSWDKPEATWQLHMTSGALLLETWLTSLSEATEIQPNYTQYLNPQPL